MEIKKVLIYPEFDLLEELEKAKNTYRSSFQSEVEAMKQKIIVIIDLIKRSGIKAFYETEQGKLMVKKQ